MFAHFCSNLHVAIYSKDSTLGIWNFKNATNFESQFLLVLEDKFQVWSHEDHLSLLHSCSVPKLCAIFSQFSSTDLLKHLKPLFDEYIKPMFKYFENYFHSSLLVKCKIWFSMDPAVRETVRKPELVNELF